MSLFGINSQQKPDYSGTRPAGDKPENSRFHALRIKVPKRNDCPTKLAMVVMF